MKRILIIAALGAAAAVASTAASAHVDVGLYLGVPAPVVAAPVYVAPQPVYVAPQPVYRAPQPVVYYGRDRWDDWRERRWEHRRWEERHDRGWHRGW
ncbi:hypothetical protein [Pandoraea sp. ISTKB]|uniref:hypothetical protein n=1 Tax=Pandoraea sp. ISTKB TaxID=1586708 RepID=UPI000846B250|nr:hypothetical protein [Pandoraea sp. ISTKB]ODP33853.1 hypothetical protein A9762_17290 [Pandoraea sp. ISTKB]